MRDDCGIIRTPVCTTTNARRTKETYFRQSDNSLHVALRLEVEYPMSLKCNSINNNNNRSS